MAAPGHRRTAPFDALDVRASLLGAREVRASTLRLSALALGALVSWPTPAGAARPPTTAPAESVKLRWDAPASECPGEAALRARVRSLLGPAPLQLDASAQVQRLPPGAAHRWRLDITLRWSARSDERTLFASDCQSLADATVVLVAVLAAPLSAAQKLGPRRQSPPAPAVGAGTSTAPAADGLVGDSTAPAADAGLPDASTVPDPAGLADAPTIPVATTDLPGEPEDLEAADLEAADLEAADLEAADLGPLNARAPREPRPPRRRGPFARVAGVLGYGALPRGDFGVSVAAGGLLPRVRVEAAATFLALQSASLGDASGRGGVFGLAAVAARACPRFLGSPVELSVCGALEFGLQGARSVGISPQRRLHGPWLALSLGAALDWWFSSQVALHAGVEGSAAPLIATYRIHEDALYMPRRFGVRANIGLTIALAPSPARPRRSPP